MGNENVEKYSLWLVDLLKHVGICHFCQCNFLKTAYADLTEYLLRILP